MTVSKTVLGMQVMKDRSVSLSAQQRSALILCDGQRSADEIVKMTAAVGVSLQDIEDLVALDLVTMNDISGSSLASESLGQNADSVQTLPTSAASGAEDADLAAALNAAITLCSSLGFKGFGLNMALTGVDNLEKLQKIAPDIRRVAGDAKYQPLHAMIFGKPL